MTAESPARGRRLRLWAIVAALLLAGAVTGVIALTAPGPPAAPVSRATDVDNQKRDLARYLTDAVPKVVPGARNVLVTRPTKENPYDSERPLATLIVYFTDAQGPAMFSVTVSGEPREAPAADVCGPDYLPEGAGTTKNCTETPRPGGNTLYYYVWQPPADPNPDPDPEFDESLPKASAMEVRGTHAWVSVQTGRVVSRYNAPDNRGSVRPTNSLTEEQLVAVATDEHLTMH